MQVWVVTTKGKNKVVGVYSEEKYATKNIKHPENVNVTKILVNDTLKKG
jgi:hypothetical protein